MYDTTKEVAQLLREMADGLEEDRPVAVMLADQSIVIPADANLKVEYEQAAGASEVIIRATWAIPVLILTHSENVLDSNGNLYSVLVYGKPRIDGTWEGWLEFVPASAGLSILRTERETTQPDRHALEYWASGLESLYFTGAFERAALLD